MLSHGGLDRKNPAALSIQSSRREQASARHMTVDER